MILVTTAGKVGSEAARVLASRGIPVRVLVRNPQKASGLRDLGVDVLVGNLDDQGSIAAALEGVNSVVLVSPAVPSQEINVVNAAVHSGAGHVVKVTSESSADSPISRRRGQAQIEQALVDSGLGYTLLKNNAYMQNFLMLAPQIAATDSFAANTGNGRVGMIDARDVAAAAAVIAAFPEPHQGKIYWPTGPEQLTYGDAAAIISKVVDRPITFRPISLEEQQQAMVNVGLPEPVAKDNTTALSLFAAGEAGYTTNDVLSITGSSPRPFEQFVRDHAVAFS